MYIYNSCVYIYIYEGLDELLGRHHLLHGVRLSVILDCSCVSCIYIYIYTHTHTYTYIYIYIHIYKYIYI